MENKQTSIEWLVMGLTSSNNNGGLKNIKTTHKDIIEKAMKIHKQEIIDSFNSGMVNSVDWFSDGLTEEAEEYYKETYGK